MHFLSHTGISIRVECLLNISAFLLLPTRNGLHVNMGITASVKFYTKKVAFRRHEEVSLKFMIRQFTKRYCNPLHQGLIIIFLKKCVGGGGIDSVYGLVFE